MQNFRIGREGFQQLKQFPQVFLHKMVGSVTVKRTQPAVKFALYSDWYAGEGSPTLSF